MRFGWTYAPVLAYQVGAMGVLPDSVLSAELGPGERLVWSGKPRGGIRLRAQDAFLIPFSRSADSSPFRPREPIQPASVRNDREREKRLPADRGHSEETPCRVTRPDWIKARPYYFPLAQS